MRVYGIVWTGVKTDQYELMRDFFADIVKLPVAFERRDFTVFELPDGDKLEIFGPAAGDPPEQFAGEHVVAGLLVDDLDAAVAELQAAGADLIGEPQGAVDGYRWQHFRAADGKVFELVRNPWHPALRAPAQRPAPPESAP